MQIHLVLCDRVMDSPDISSYMIALRAELNLKIVMPEVVPHSSSAPLLTMARFEVGDNGNPHHHGFAVGGSARGTISETATG